MKIAVIGGGTGMPSLLRGLKHYEHEITAIVTMFDDGGGSGILRQELGMLPPGDVRNCILALSDTEPLMEAVFNYRFPYGRLKNQNFGNLMIAAMNGVTGSFLEAVKRLSDILAIRGRVLPVTTEDAQLCAVMRNGQTVVGESAIPEYAKNHHTAINRVFLTPADLSANPEAVTAILEADAVIIAPGSLYTSIMPILLLDEIRQALLTSSAQKIYVCNVMTQNGETDGFDVAAHLRAIAAHVGKQMIDIVMVNQSPISEEILNNYLRESAHVVHMDEEKVRAMGVKVVYGAFAVVLEELAVLRHDSREVAQAIDALVYGREV